MKVPFRSTPTDRSAYSAFFRAVNDDIVALNEGSRLGDRRILCECSRRDCSSTLMLTPDFYRTVRRNERHFFVAPGHELPGAQHVVVRYTGFAVVEQNDGLAELDPLQAGFSVNRLRPVVLVVDDEPAIRELCSACLQESDIVVLEAGDGREGLEQARSWMPNLVITDISMPILDGFRLAAALRRDELTASIPIIFLSGETSHESEAHGMDFGAFAYLRKPFDPQQLTSVATGVLARFA
ncbi:MAG: two-component system, sensor histidine kinase and response regulator [Gaiellaceae bacterium]|jgi:CheY-like chemotaxis protein|nr:two-component system, sensor histidine kinase and response regulator [Gaiellaceae bacterium]